MNVQTSAVSFRGFSAPQYTPVPDELFDQLMVDLTLAELRIVLYICRRTFGFKKREDSISLSQMLNGIRKKDGTTLDRGIGLSKRTLLPALRGLVSKGIITKNTQVAASGGSRASVYALRFRRTDSYEGGEMISPPPGEETSSPSGEDISPHKKQSSKNRETTPSRKLAKVFYEKLGCRVSGRKLDRGEEEIEDLFSNGFSKDEVQYAIEYMAKNYPDTKTIARLSFLIDEALKHRKQEEHRAKQAAERQAFEQQRKQEQSNKQEKLSAARKKFESLPEAEKERWRARAPHWMNRSWSKTAWAVAQFQSEKEQKTINKTEGEENHV